MFHGKRKPNILKFKKDHKKLDSAKFLGRFLEKVIFRKASKKRLQFK